MSFVLFITRSEKRSLYAIGEIIVGISSVFYSIYRIIGSFDIFSAALATMAGMYIIIRGLDNLEKSESGDIVRRLFEHFLIIIRTGKPP